MAGEKGFSYTVVELTADGPLEELITQVAFDQGCLGLEAMDGGLRMYFPPLSKDDPLLKILVAHCEGFFGKGNFTFHLSEITDPGWDLTWRNYFEPQWVGEKILIVAPWHDYPKPRDVTVINMDPGPAFGTGRHATTRMCLLAINAFLEEIPIGFSILDVGTGSGILAIYAALSGAGRVVGIDIDEEALRWAGRNLSLNKLEGRVELSRKGLREIDGPFDMAVANITLRDIKPMIREIKAKLSEKGILILSGLLCKEREELLLDAKRAKLEPVMSMFEEEWTCLCLQNQ